MTPDHAAYVDAVAGIARRHGITVVPRVDVDTGDPLPELEVATVFQPGVTIVLIVPPPPDGWTLPPLLAEAP